MAVVQHKSAAAPFISEPLTWTQICERYPDEWVCLVEIDRVSEADLEFRTARVVGHGKHPRDPYVQARPFRDRYIGLGHYFTGRIRARIMGMVIE